MLQNEYVNYYHIARFFQLYDVEKIKKRSDSIFVNCIQFLVEDRILYRWKKQVEPYTGYEDIYDKKDKKIIEKQFKIYLTTQLYNTNEKFKYHNETSKGKIDEIIKKYFQKLSIRHCDINKFKEEMNQFNEPYLTSWLSEKINISQTVRKLFLKYIKHKKRLFVNDYSDTSSEIQIFADYVVYKNIKIPLDSRLNYLLTKGGKEKFMILILRYLGYGITGQHCALPIKVYEYLFKNLNVKGEGFSSPLNSKLIEMKDTTFSTLFYDTDKYFGSAGPFSHKTLIDHQTVNWTANTPYFPNVMKMMYKEIKRAFKQITRNDFFVICLVPKWEHDVTYQKLKNSKYLATTIEPEIGKHYMNCNGRYVYMNGVVNVMFILSKNKNVIESYHVQNIKKIWDEFNANDKQQSKIEEPIII
jgi:hypothetical protein